MIAVIQRVRQASVMVGDSTVAKIERGLLVLLGVATGDSERDVAYVVEKISNLRLFSDENGKMNHSLKDVQGELLVVSQFTLLANMARGRRPSFEEAAPPEEARSRYQQVLEGLRLQGLSVQAGLFGADMLVSLENDGPVTFVLDSRGNNRVQN